MKKLIVILLSSFILISCGDDFTLLAPLSQRNVDNFYKTDSDFEVAINGLYDALQSDGTYNNNYILLFEMRADNSENGGGASGLANDLERIDKFEEIPTNKQSERAWSSSYKGIARANQILDKIDGVEISKKTSERIIGEALFIRSLLYYNLAVAFGNIPLQLEPVTSSEVVINQVNSTTVYEQISIDLEQAASLLPKEYDGNKVGKATSYAALTLLGKVYLTNGQKQEAEVTLRKVLGKYELVDDYEDIWGVENENNKESIFEIQFKSGGIGEGSRFTDIYTPLGKGGGVGGGNAPQDITNDIIDAFDQNNDKRFKATFELDPDTQKPEYVKKFASIPFGPFDADNNWIEFRYADVLLMLSEAIGETPESYGYINQVRQRAGLGPIDSSTPGSFEEKLLKERRLEFAFENKRWPDLKRFGVAKQVMSNHLNLPESRITLLYPIPEQEIYVKPDQMKQNPEHQ